MKLHFAVFTALMCVPFVAHANDITFDVSSSSVSGTVQINTSAGALNSTDLIVQNGSDTVTVTGGGGSPNGDNFSTLLMGDDGNYYQFNIYTDYPGSLKGFTGGSFDLSTDAGSGIEEYMGELEPEAPPPPPTTPTSVTPEPSSFALLGTGLLGTAGVVRRRFA